MSDSIIERLRHHAQDERNTAFARSTMREAECAIALLERTLEQEQISSARAMSGLADAVLKLRAERLAGSQREERVRNALRALLESDNAGAIASASDDDLLAAIADESAGDVVRMQAAAIFSARAVLAEGEQR
ncbi:MAG TPA: hypothetical protein VFF26_06875 [Gallionella sp.]|nr:hypothetical protein [Gallionella sp.]